MNIKQTLLLKWHRFLINQKFKMEQILEDVTAELPPNYPAHPLYLNEYFTEYDPDQQLVLTKRMMKTRLENLKLQISKTILHNNGRLSFEQIHELEYIKSIMNRCESLQNEKRK